ncbi:pyridoxal phosphate-dependent aminotransferase [Xiashengella succiniciproducens]|uniref:Pyridoxal phosphate-dependent aminotransferase n=1 Tax=Xiashengella succiniciproducens TaxID=2949635 RepID=A0A9J6ZRE4_9BACT|nr:pyridoxal phosphate-dependent aminotransferase [Alkaliflexus sp. Ai-910]URW80177.1 pyridoxal phosphate-dependent aminotransferase [Alkaliflexus sp. Ai-910]
MPSISHRGTVMPASPIRRLVPFAEQAKNKGIKVFHLNIGQPDIKTPQVALEAMHSLDLNVIEYGHSAGRESYIKKLSAYYKTKGININTDQLMITTGGSEAISLAFLSCLDVGDEVIVPEPFYANYYGFASSTGVKVVPLSSDIDTSFALPSFSEIEKLITDRTRAIFICNPNNPTGYLYSREELEQLKDIVKRHDLYLLSDEVYSEFCYDGAQHISIMELEGLEDHTVMIDSVSKRYSECGLRIGMLLSRNPRIIETALKFAQARLCPPTLGQIAAEASLETPEEYFRETNVEYNKRRNFLIERLNRIPGVFSPMPKGAFYTVARLPVDDADKFCQWVLSDFSYNNQTVMMAPASGFYITPGKGTKEVRIAYVLNIDDLAAAIDILERALEAYPNRCLD